MIYWNNIEILLYSIAFEWRIIIMDSENTDSPSRGNGVRITMVAPIKNMAREPVDSLDIGSLDIDSLDIVG